MCLDRIDLGQIEGFDLSDLAQFDLVEMFHPHHQSGLKSDLKQRLQTSKNRIGPHFVGLDQGGIDPFGYPDPAFEPEIDLDRSDLAELALVHLGPEALGFALPDLEATGLEATGRHRTGLAERSRRRLPGL